MKKLSALHNHELTKLVVVFCITVFFAVALLAAAAFLPQEQILEHILESVDLVAQDVKGHYILDRSKASKLDVGTDVMILRTSLSTQSRYLGAILTNPIYTFEGLNEWDDIPETLARLAYQMPHDNVSYYARYWMGFRAPMRLALTFFNYAQIKRYLAFLFFSLFAAATCSVAKHTNEKMAFAFAVSIILIKPYIMATSMQFTSCFLIAFVAMLLVPWLYRNPKMEMLFFMEIGMITMYFDFYTVPPVTFGFPMLYLYLLQWKDGKALPIKQILRNFTVWIAGYGLMWIAKLVLTTVCTSVNALAQGFDSFAVRMGIVKEESSLEYYSIKAAFEAVREAMFSDSTGAAVYGICAALILITVLLCLLKRRIGFAAFRGGLPILVLAAIPILWFCAAKQPVAIHAYFQYRSIALTHWAAAAYLYTLFSDNRTKDKLLA